MKTALLETAGVEQTEGQSLRFSTPDNAQVEPRFGFKWLTADAQYSEIIHRLQRGERSDWVLAEARRFDIEIPKD